MLRLRLRQEQSSGAGSGCEDDSIRQNLRIPLDGRTALWPGGPIGLPCRNECHAPCNRACRPERDTLPPRGTPPAAAGRCCTEEEIRGASSGRLESGYYLRAHHPFTSAKWGLHLLPLRTKPTTLLPAHCPGIEPRPPVHPRLAPHWHLEPSPEHHQPKRPQLFASTGKAFIHRNHPAILGL